MKELVEYIAKQLVNNPDAVLVEEDRNGDEVNLLLTVDPTDMGIIIGKSGQTIKAIRRLIITRAMGDNVKVNLRLNEENNGPVMSEDQAQDSEEPSNETRTDATDKTDPSETTGDSLTEDTDTTDNTDSVNSESEDNSNS